MSIPPLVCSTPPPPEQCEEDKDSEDFDIHYNLSQEDDDEVNDYAYGNFTTINHLQTKITYNMEESSVNEQDAPVENNIEQPKDQILGPPVNITEERLTEIIPQELNHIDSQTTESSLKCGEDNNVEDLNLKLEECTVISIKPIIVENDDSNYDLSVTLKHETIQIPNVENEIDEQNINVTILENQEDLEIKIDYNDKTETTENYIPESLPICEDVDSNEDNINPCSNIEKTEINNPDNNLQNSHDNDFDDFDDFQFSSPEIKSNIVIDNCESPWEKNDEDDEFGTFTATFDQMQKDDTDKHIAENSDNISFGKFEVPAKETVPSITEEDDDFGDFDDFKSNIVNTQNKDTTTVERTENCQQMPVFSLEVADKGHQILDDEINHVLNSIFLEELTEPNEYEYKLESLLSETWRHLMETDIRQPYIVNWNNSLGQKTLLRALCIDSRNILFGPKWSHNMPKYAVTMSTAPLQPQKPAVLTSNESTPVERNANAVANWTDPFSSNGQESCNTENEAASVERKPANQEFVRPLPTKPDSLYSSNIPIQPMRHISLPDTHIFTPTDSETPRSKTIHYDTRPMVLMPEQHTISPTFHSVENSVAKPDLKAEPLDDSDYWEFQDFKSTPKLNSTETSTSEITPVAPITTSATDDAHNLNKPFQELLQPIKINPVAPTLNWPNPGEVKEMFDDFSDFVTNSVWSAESKDTSGDILNNGPISEKERPKNINDKFGNTNDNEAIRPNLTDDDEFDTFQYVLPTQNINENPKIDILNTITSSNIKNITPRPVSTKQNAFEEPFSQLNFDLSGNIPTSQPSKNLIKSTSSMTNESCSKPIKFHSPQSNVLQPIPVSSNTHKKTGQILQPLSLESYSQLNWPSPGIDLQDLSKFNPVETLNSLKSDITVGANKNSPIHNQKAVANNQVTDDDMWGEFVSSKPQPSNQKKTNFADDDEWTDFVSSPNVKPQNGLNTISFNVHTNSNMQKNTYQNELAKNNQTPIDLPTLNYITPKTNHKSYNERHFQNL